MDCKNCPEVDNKQKKCIALTKQIVILKVITCVLSAILILFISLMVCMYGKLKSGNTDKFHKTEIESSSEIVIDEDIPDIDN